MRTILRALPLALILAACSSSESSGGTEDAGVDAPAATPQSACTHDFEASVARCATGLLSPQTVTDARTRYVSNCVAELALPGTQRTATTVEACAAALEALPCLPDRQLVAACAPTAGILGLSAPCNTHDQCASRYCDFSSPGGTPGCGKCVAPLAAGANCSKDGDPCPADMVCAPSLTDTNTTCKPLSYAARGAACNGINVICQADSICIREGDAEPKCAAPLADGKQCGNEDGVCGEASYCNRSTGNCAPRAKEGAACSSQILCERGFGCTKDTSKCAPLTFVGAGEPCGGNIGCVVGVCGQGTGAPSCPEIVEDTRGCVEGAHMSCRAPASCVDDKCLMSASVVCR